MGNWFGKKRVVHRPHDVEGIRSNIIGTASTQYSEKIDSSSGSVRIKVRMTKREMEEMMALANHHDHQSKGGEALGRLIFQQCLEGRWRARVDTATVTTTTYPDNWPMESFKSSRRCLGTITEERTAAS